MFCRLFMNNVCAKAVNTTPSKANRAISFMVGAWSIANIIGNRNSVAILF